MGRYLTCGGLGVTHPLYSAGTNFGPRGHGRETHTRTIKLWDTYTCYHSYITLINYQVLVTHPLYSAGTNFGPRGHTRETHMHNQNMGGE